MQVNHACECGHQPAAHTETGLCNSLDDNGYPCNCSRYEWQGDN